MISLPFTALALFFTRPRLFALGVLPGLFTFAASAGLVYALWASFLQGRALFVSLPVMGIAFLLAWIVIGKIALVPVEDAIVDECQRALWGEVRLAASGLTWRRLARECSYSLAFALAGVVSLPLLFWPGVAPLEFVLAAWLSAYSFLTPLYSRRVGSKRGRVTLFFERPVVHFLLGAFLNAVLFVPILNVFLLGYAQVLSTLVYFQDEAASVGGRA